MKKNLILVILLGIAPLQFVGQTQLLIDPNSTIQQLNFSSVVMRSPNEYFACGILPVGSDFGMVARFTDTGMLWSNYFNNSSMSCIGVASDGQLLTVGEFSAKAFVARVDQSGALVWVNSSITDAGASPTHVLESLDGYIYVTGQRFLANDQFLTKLSSAGILAWAKRPFVSIGVVDHSRIILRDDSLLCFNDPIMNDGLVGDLELRILDSDGNQFFHRTYGVPGNVREMLTSVVEIPGQYYVLATTRPGALGIVVLDQNFDIVKSRSYVTPGGTLENGKLLYDDGHLYMVCDKLSAGSPRALVLKLDTASLDPVWNKALSSANSFPTCEPFMDGTLRVPYTRYPSFNGSVRGVVLASVDPATGNFTGTACESPPLIVINSGPYTGLIQTNQPASSWVDLAIVSSPIPNFSGYPLLLEDCEPGILVNPLHIKAFLGGSYDQVTGLMWDSLRVKNLIYTVDPHNPNGVVHPGVFDVEGSDAIVDWVAIELRDPLNPQVVLDSVSALIQRDGDVVGLDGTSRPITNLTGGSYYVALRHRNHLGVCTASAVPTSSTVDFTSLSTTTYGMEAQKHLGGARVMWEGDVLFNNDIKYVGQDNDRDPILSVIGGSIPTSVVSDVYSNADVNMDGLIKYVGVNNDRDPLLFNIGGSVPTNTRLAQLP
jgi:hypothetical protein